MKWFLKMGSWKLGWTEISHKDHSKGPVGIKCRKDIIPGFSHQHVVVVLVLTLSHVQLFCDPVDCSLPGSSIHGISQARLLEWVAISSFRESSQPRDGTRVTCIGRRILYHWAAKGTLIIMYTLYVIYTTYIFKMKILKCTIPLIKSYCNFW